MTTETEMADMSNTALPEAAATSEPTEDRTEGVDLEGAVEPRDDDDANDDDDDVTIIMLDQNVANDSRRPEDAFAWIESNAPEMEERRRIVLVRELRRVQRAMHLPCTKCIILKMWSIWIRITGEF